MKSTNILLYASCLFSAMFLFSCASITGFQTGRTVEKGHGEFSAALNVTQTPNFNDNGMANDIPSVFLPVMEVGGRYGVGRNVDVGLRLSTSLNFLIDGKYQFIGDQESPFAMAVGGAFGGFMVSVANSSLLNFQVPLYASYHPTEKLHLYLTPRYIGQFGSVGSLSSDLLNYTGANAGILFGKKTKFGIDIGYYGLSVWKDKFYDTVEYDEFKSSVINIGVGFSTRF